MKTILLGMIAALAVAGCSSSGDGDAVKPQVALNPSAKPRNSQESAMSQEYQAAGERANAQMEEAAKAIKKAHP